MMQKGTYSSFIAIIAVILAITIIIFSINIEQRKETIVQKNSIMQAKKSLQNAVLLLDKVVGDAIADAVYTNNCSTSLSSIEPKIREYFSSVDADIAQCTITVNSVTQSGNLYATNFSVECEQSIPNQFSVLYKKTKSFEREAVALLSGNNCTIEIKDGTTEEFTKTGILP